MAHIWSPYSSALQTSSSHRSFSISIVRPAEHTAKGAGITQSLQYYKQHSGSITSLSQAIESQLFSKSAPGEEDVVAALHACKDVVKQKRTSPHATKVSPAAAILSLEDASKSVTLNPVVTVSALPSADPADLQDLAELAFSIINHPTVFITEPILSSYVDLCVSVRSLNSLPAAFALYAKKPILRSGSKTPRKTNPILPKYAIPDAIATQALDAAISAEDMELALDIISTTYGAPAYRWNKIIRRALPAGAAVVVSPAAMYVLADAIARYQDVVQHDVAVKYAFVGLLAYLGFTGSLGLIAMTTANDQMLRVTWLVGTPLRTRWLMEEERAAYDKVAQAWGFQDPYQRGFEEGPEWELLKEYVAGRSMVLDDPGLMEGME
ncbi:hypothetical protein BDZ91DRAFT_662779 [Kalaharituber pfeilii]|nr:hypothetical protein BDZ91DRAFT_662779 [Kalaharituber pfeilii]